MFKIGKKKIGDGNPTYITFEIGPTHNGLKSCLKYLDITKNVGADALKIQMVDAERLISNKKQLFEFSFLSKNRKKLIKKEESLFEILKRRQLSKEEIIKLKKSADKKNIEFFCTIFFEDDVDFVKEIGCKSIKIASADLNHLPLIKKAAKSGLSIQIDTGMSSLKEIYSAVKEIKSQNNNNIIIHHCPSGYPARLDGIDLNIIKTLKSKFKFPIAFSDHYSGYDFDILAVALGANLIEKTITFDRTVPEVEHVMSIETSEASKFVNKIRNTEVGLGKYNRILDLKQKKKRDKVRRSAFWKRNQLKGTKLSFENIEFKRPAYGIKPDEIQKFYGKMLRINVFKNNLIKKSDFKK